VKAKLRAIKSKQYKKRVIIFPAILAISVLAIGILATNIKAQEFSSYPPLVQKIAEKFNLNIDEVEQIFDEEHDERRADAYARFAERLNDLVSEGKLTEGQKDALLQEHEEMHNKMEEFINLSPDERKEKIREAREEMRIWMEQEGLDLSHFGPMKYGFKHGFGKGYKFGY